MFVYISIIMIVILASNASPGEANGLCHVLTVACPKPRPTMWDLSPQTRDKWEIDRSEVEFLRKLGSGNFGDVWYGKSPGYRLPLAPSGVLKCPCFLFFKL